LVGIRNIVDLPLTILKYSIKYYYTVYYTFLFEFHLIVKLRFARFPYQAVAKRLSF